MRCPVCNHKSTRVVDSREVEENTVVRRRRECERKSCGFRFSTSEEVEMLDIHVIKRDGSRESYQRDKLIVGLKKSLEKRPYTNVQFHALVHKIERDIRKRRGGEVTSATLGEIVMKHLKRFDKVAYIRFASVYHSFDDIDKFEEELRRFSTKKKSA